MNATIERPRAATLHPCAHCKANIQRCYSLCSGCMETLPEPLRREITRNNPNAQQHWRNAHNRGVSMARAYLAADDRAAHIKQQAEAGEDWAIRTLAAAGELDATGEAAIYRARAARRAGGGE